MTVVSLREAVIRQMREGRRKPDEKPPPAGKGRTVTEFGGRGSGVWLHSPPPADFKPDNNQSETR